MSNCGVCDKKIFRQNGCLYKSTVNGIVCCSPLCSNQVISGKVSKKCHFCEQPIGKSINDLNGFVVCKNNQCWNKALGSEIFQKFKFPSEHT